MTQRDNILIPVGRLVYGSLYEPLTTDAEGKRLVNRTTGEDAVKFSFGVAVPKGSEKHWGETPWGATIWANGHASFPNGAAQSPTFAWKIKDGDSTIPNTKGNKPCDAEGWQNCWVLNLSSQFQPRIVNADGSQPLLEVGFVNLGDYIEIAASVVSNKSTQQPGIHINHSIVAFAGYGKRIILGVDPKTVGFGKAPLPPGASVVPINQGFTPPPIASGSSSVTPTTYIPPVITPVSAQPVITPYPAILNTPMAPAAPTIAAKIMLPAAQGISYEQYIANNWTDALLIQHGYMQA